MTILSGMTHPRSAEDIRWSEMPEAIRFAFETAHTIDDVFTACRMADKMLGMSGGHHEGYLMGCLLPRDWDRSEGWFAAVRYSAQQYSEAVAA